MTTPEPTLPAILILVVDDNPDTTMLLEFALKRRGRDVVTASGVKEAMEVARTQKVDLLVSDIGLRDGNGHDLMRQIRALAPTAPIRGIAISGHGGTEDLEQSQAAGFAMHLVKPVSLDALEAAVVRILA
jgi:CheY-like chemotaxis protein